MRVVLVDDHQVFLDSFRIALGQEPAIEVVGEATSARAARPLAEALHPDLMVMDLMLGDSDAVTLTRELRGGGASCRILILSAHENELFVRDAFTAGADGFALKDQPLAEVVEAIRVVSTGGRYLAPSLGPLAAAAPPGRASASGQDRLSRREREIFGLIVQGRSSRDIADSLSISLKTVETHRAHINKKLGVRSPAELIRVAALQGLVVPSSARTTRAM